MGSDAISKFTRQSPLAFTKRHSGSRFYWPVHSPTTQTPLLFTSGNVRENDGPQFDTFFIQAHAASAIVLNRIAIDWWRALTSQRGVDPDLIDDRVIKAPTKSPYVSKRCAEPLDTATSEKNVQFPTLNAQGAFAESSSTSVDALKSTAVDHLRFQWILLPENFGTSSVGAIYESPWRSNGSRLVIGCSIQVRWVPTTIYTDKYSFWTGWYPWDIHFENLSPPRVPGQEGEPLLPTNGRIAFGKDWLDLLTPPAPAIGPGDLKWKPSTIESILDNAGLAEIAPLSNKTTPLDDWLEKDTSGGSKSTLLEAIICSVLVDGVSRSGSHRLFDTEGPPSQWPLATYKPAKDFEKAILADSAALEFPDAPESTVTVLHADMEITGFAFRRSLAVYLAASVLLIYLAMAASHTIWVTFSKRTSSSWSTVSELIALSLNSQPAFDSLSNTGGGIHYSTTYSRVAKIRARPQPNDPDSDHVELVFEDSNAHLNCDDGSESWEMITSQEERLISRVHPSWTWPQDPYSSSIPLNEPNNGRDAQTSSTETPGLSRRVRKGTAGDIIYVNRAYG